MFGMFSGNRKQAQPSSPFATHQPSTKQVKATNLQPWKTKSVENFLDNGSNLDINNSMSKSSEVLTNASQDNTSEDLAGSRNGNSKDSKFTRILSQTNVDIDTLRKLCWSGIPEDVRAMCWRLLLGYLPTNVDRQGSTLDRKRKEYEDFVVQYSTKVETDYEKAIYKQIELDIPRTHPDMKLFQNPAVQKSLQRVLYIWAVRHPATGYVQGINDLATPFFVVFLSEFIGTNYQDFPVEELGPNIMSTIEADCFWCMTKLLDNLTENYTFAQPGIQRMLFKLKELMSRIDVPLSKYLDEHEVQYMQFSYRWMNCLLMREIPLNLVIRMWDTYFSETDIVSFHVYVCAAFLHHWSATIRAQIDFPSILLFLQSTPTSHWLDRDIDEILSQAFIFMALYQNSPSHLRANTAD